MGYDIACHVDITNRKGVRHEELWVSYYVLSTYDWYRGLG